MTTPILWQFRLSHYCEKVRWALDYKSIEYRCRDFPPGLHAGPALIKSGQRLLPVLGFRGRWINDSTAIIESLERHRPEPALYPEDEATRGEALGWEDYLDLELGPYTRSMVFDAAWDNPKEALDQALPFKPPFFNLGLFFAGPGISLTGEVVRAVSSSGKINRGKIGSALDMIEARIAHSDYLAGKSFSVADLCAASLLSPIMDVPELPYRPVGGLGGSFAVLYEEFADRLGIQWAKEIYRRHRKA